MLIIQFVYRTILEKQKDEKPEEEKKPTEDYEARVKYRRTLELVILNRRR